MFTTAEARADDWTRSALLHAVRTGTVIRLARGAYVPAAGWDDEGPEAARRRAAARTVAAVLTIGPARASHTSATILAGLPVWRLPDRPCVTVPPRYTGDAEHVHLHRATTLPEHHVPDAVIPRLVVARNVIDIAREHSIEDALVVGDAALHRRMTDAARLACAAEFCAGWPGMRRAAGVLEVLDGRAESPLESVSRLRLALAGMPTPELQPKLYALDGTYLGRPDLYWDEFGVAGEVDGRTKYATEPEQEVWRDKRRQEPMEDVGIIFVRWGSTDLAAMSWLCARLQRAFARGARRPRADRGWTVEPSAPPALPRQVTPAPWSNVS